MSEKYTYDDVIINPKDPRVEIGAEYCFGDIPQNLVEAANSNNNFWARLEQVSVSEGFNFKREGGGWRSLLIRKKDSEKYYIPFDLSNKKDRARLRGVWIRPKDEPLLECQIYAIDSDYIFVWARDGYLTPKELLDNWTFEDGTPCGKLIKED